MCLAAFFGRRTAVIVRATPVKYPYRLPTPLSLLPAATPRKSNPQHETNRTKPVPSPNPATRPTKNPSAPAGGTASERYSTEFLSQTGVYPLFSHPQISDVERTNSIKCSYHFSELVGFTDTQFTPPCPSTLGRYIYKVDIIFILEFNFMH